MCELELRGDTVSFNASKSLAVRGHLVSGHSIFPASAISAGCSQSTPNDDTVDSA